MIRLRRLTAAGWTAFERALDSLDDERPLTGPPLPLTDPALSEPHPVALQVDDARDLGRRYDAAEYFFSVLGSGRIENVEQDLMLWAWLSAVYFDQLCPQMPSGLRKLGERARYLPSGDFQRGYRHLLAGPYRIFQSHFDEPSRTWAVLTGRLDVPGELAEQLSARVEVIATPSILAAATLLYVDPATKTPKRGAAGKKTRGSVRRFGQILKQYDLTLDLAGMRPEAILSRLPPEFDAFKS